MRYRVHLSRRAEGDLAAAYAYIAAQSPTSAANWLQTMVARIEALAEFPRAYPIAEENGDAQQPALRKMTVQNYRVLYTVHDDDGMVRVHHVWHAARRMPWERDAEAPAANE